MNPYLLTATFAAQIFWLYQDHPSAGALGWALAGLLLFAAFALTRLRWGAHLDMYLIMLGPGALAMMLPAGGACPLHASWAHYGWMSLAMWAVSLPWTWVYARCLRQARQIGRAWTALAFDAAGMQIGMALAHLSGSLFPARLLLKPELPWIGHALMLLGMALGMLAASYASLEYEDGRRKSLPSSVR
ncbi:MAG: hypothetical protein NW208_08745 [Bryobacter sp.]|nr:hypothetical protein [Bryobacter sp.]